MSTVEVNLKLDKADFYYVNNVIVETTYKVFSIDTTSKTTLNGIIFGLRYDRIDSDIPKDTLAGYLEHKHCECTGGSGSAGLSAYDIAVKNGFVGTEQDWLNSLVGGNQNVVTINDIVPSGTSVYSSQKIEQYINSKIPQFVDAFNDPIIIP